AGDEHRAAVHGLRRPVVDQDWLGAEGGQLAQAGAAFPAQAPDADPGAGQVGPGELRAAHRYPSGRKFRLTGCSMASVSASDGASGQLATSAASPASRL